MNIIRKEPNFAGDFPSTRQWNNPIPPTGYYEVADSCDTSAIQTHAGFIKRTIVNNVVTEITGDDAAYQAWKAAHPTITQVSPETDRDNMLVDHEYRLTILELGVN